MRERVPDRVLEDADEIVVVDVTPETLEERLLEGKIYAPEKIEQSLENFFQRRHLIALRELALRRVAATLKRGSNFKRSILQHSRTSISVHLNLSNSLQLLRRGARIASYTNAQFYAVFVTDPDQFLTKAESLHVKTCEKLCQEFSGQFLRVNGTDIAKAIPEVAKQYRITQIVIGESQQSRWKLLLRGSLTNG